MIEAAGAEGETGAGRRRAWMFPRAVCRDAGEKNDADRVGRRPPRGFHRARRPECFPDG